MTIRDILDTGKISGVSGLFCAMGSFGIIEAGAEYLEKTDGKDVVYECEVRGVRLSARFTRFENGVIRRRDILENLSGKTVTVNKLSSRYRLDGGKYEIYTQFNGWQHESTGGWQPLVTQVAAAGQGIKSCYCATPVLAAHNVYSKKNYVFHLFPNGLWKMTARKYGLSDRECTIIETGFDDEGLNLSVMPEEKIDLPEVFFFSADNKTDLDAYKLHEVYNSLYPRRALPVLYNTWLCDFDNIDIDNLKKQATAASEIGIEAFMVDAGWFGHGSWGEGVGDWVENETEGPKGRLKELSDYVRKCGMIFGLWFEPERAGANCRAAKEHPEYYINGRFFDFSSEKAREYMLSEICRNVEKYNIGWIKFDFNDSIPFDALGGAFYRYFIGQRKFVEELNGKYPDIYITNCASGGGRMDLFQALFTDSFWFTDNQGPYGGLRIIKDTVKRMPSALIERWNVQKYIEGVPRYGFYTRQGMMINCNNATWESVIRVSDAFNEAFMTGGPIGFSCDIASFPEEYKNKWKSAIEKFKKDRNFYISALAKILVDEEDITAIEYFDKNRSRCIVQVFTKVTYAYDLTVYPDIDKGAEYVYNGEAISGKEIYENGIRIKDIMNNDCVTIELLKRN